MLFVRTRSVERGLTRTTGCHRVDPSREMIYKQEDSGCCNVCRHQGQNLCFPEMIGAFENHIGNDVSTSMDLVIRWNKIQDVNNITTGDQTIPLVIGIGSVVRVLYVKFISGDDFYGPSVFRYRLGKEFRRGCCPG